MGRGSFYTQLLPWTGQWLVFRVGYFDRVSGCLRPSLAPASMLLDNGAQMRPPVQPTRTPARRQSVVVVGGGFAGLNLIQHLRDAPVNIVLVDRCNHHLFQPLLYQVATAALAPTEIAEPTRSILRNARNVTVRLDEVIGVEMQAARRSTRRRCSKCRRFSPTGK
jgi:Pyridine nucleotide-disulphide oxidoreductase